MSGSCTAKVLIDNERVIVTEYRFKPGENTGWHVHGHDYVVVPLMDGKLRIESKAGTSIAPMTAGGAYFRQKGVEHDVINASAGEYAFIEVEVKS
jgi:beta-alanine degradation protein BauB